MLSKSCLYLPSFHFRLLPSQFYLPFPSVTVYFHTAVPSILAQNLNEPPVTITQGVKTKYKRLILLPFKQVCSDGSVGPGLRAGNLGSLGDALLLGVVWLVP